MADIPIRAVITAEDQASKTLQGFSAKTVAVGAAIGTALGNVATSAVRGLVSELGNAAKRVDTLNNANRTFENMGFQTGQVKIAMDSLNKSILGLPTPLDQAVQGVEMLAAANNDVGKAQGIFSALNDAILGFGGTAFDVQGAVLQLSQDMAGGRLQAQTWNSLLQSGLGPTLAAMGRQMGKTTRELKDGLSDGSISVEDFTNRLIDMDKNGGGGLKSLQQIAKDSTNGIGSSFANAKTAVIRSLASILNTIGQKNIANAINQIGTSIARLITLAGKLGKEVVAYLGPAFGKLGQIFQTFVLPSLQSLDKVIDTQLTPALKKLWDQVSPVLIPALEFLGKTIGIVLVASIVLAVKALTEIAKIVTFVATEISKLITWAEKAGQKIGKVFQEAKDLAGKALNDMVAGFKAFKEEVDKDSKIISDWFIKHKQTLEDIATVIGIIVIPAFIRLNAQAIATAAVNVAQAAIAGAAWVAQATVATAAWLIRLPFVIAEAIATAIILSAQAVIAGVAWTIQAGIASGAWLLQMGRVAIAGAIASADLVASAVVAGIAWIIALGPVTLAIIAIGLAGFVIMKNWETVKNWFNSLWGWLKSNAAGAAGYITNVFLNALGPIGQVARAIMALRSAGSDARGALHSLHIPGFATGVQNFSGGLAVVGERGPELVNLPRGSSVTPNNQIARSAPVTVNVTFSGVFTGNQSEFRKLAVDVFKAANDAAGAKNMSLQDMISV